MPPFYQPLILAPVPATGRFLTYDLRLGEKPGAALDRLAGTASPEWSILGVGQPLALAMGATVPGLRAFAGMCGPGPSFPSTQAALWVFVAADDSSELHDRTSSVCASLVDTFVLREEVTTFRYRGGRDLSGYEDGTENPKGDKAIAAAIVQGRGAGLDGGSFVAVQRWMHDLAHFFSLSKDSRDQTIGRRIDDNAELQEAPARAHVKRAAQESFDPEAFMVRRSMPWGGASERGLYFVAYGESLDRFERVLRRMAGAEDGIVDGLLTFTRAVSGGYYWCPPLRGGALDLSRVDGASSERPVAGG